MEQIDLLRALLASLLGVSIALIVTSRARMAVGPLDMDADAVVVVASAVDIWCRALGGCWVWWDSFLQVCADLQGRRSRSLH